MNALDAGILAQDTYEEEYGKTPFSRMSLVKKMNIKDHHEVYLYESEDEFAVMFQGSNGTRDWLNNFSFFRSDGELIIPYGNDKSDIRVHSGILNNYKPMRTVVLNELSNRIGRKLCTIGGHSLGGGNATLCTVDVSYNLNVALDTFCYGAPNVGNPAFYDSLYRRLGDKIKNFRNNEDLVCRVPFRLGSYYGKPKRIQISNGKQEKLGWTPWGNWKDHYPYKYVEALQKAGYPQTI